MTTSLATQLAARDMGGNAVYRDLKPGDLFRFPTKRGSQVTYEKGVGGWYSLVAGPNLAYPKPKFRTGGGTAVLKLT